MKKAISKKVTISLEMKFMNSKKVWVKTFDPDCM